MEVYQAEDFITKDLVVTIKLSNSDNVIATYHLHSQILGFASPFFRSMLNSYKESYSGKIEIVLEREYIATFDNMIKHIYREFEVIDKTSDAYRSIIIGHKYIVYSFARLGLIALSHIQTQLNNPSKYINAIFSEVWLDNDKTYASGFLQKLFKYKKTSFNFFISISPTIMSLVAKFIVAHLRMRMSFFLSMLPWLYTTSDIDTYLDIQISFLDKLAKVENQESKYMRTIKRKFRNHLKTLLLENVGSWVKHSDLDFNGAKYMLYRKKLMEVNPSDVVGVPCSKYYKCDIKEGFDNYAFYFPSFLLYMEIKNIRNDTYIISAEKTHYPFITHKLPRMTDIRIKLDDKEIGEIKTNGVTFRGVYFVDDFYDFDKLGISYHE